MEDNAYALREDGFRQAGVGARLLREVLKTPSFMQIIKTFMQGMDPESARELIRTFVWGDIDFSLSLVGSVPDLVNYLGAAVLELGKQMNNFPPDILYDFMAQAVSEVDVEVFLEYPEVYGQLLKSLKAEEVAPTVIGKTVNTFSRVITSAYQNNPNFIGDLLGEIEWREVLRAYFAVVGSIARWLISSITRRFRKG